MRHTQTARCTSVVSALLPLCSLLVLLLAAGCGGKGPVSDLAPVDGALPGPLTEVQQRFPGIPALPEGQGDEAQPVRVTLTANIKEGSDFLDKSDSASAQDSDLLLSGTADDFAWGLYRWGKFKTSDKPTSVTLDLGPGADFASCYVLVSNYTLERWDLLGQMEAESDSFSYKGGTSYLSPERNTYLIVVQSFNTSSLLDKLTLQANSDVNAPVPPTGLSITELLPREVSLGWDANTEPDLQGYNIYRGPQDGPDNPNQQQFLLNEDAILLDPSYLDPTLQEQQTYYYWVTALDDTGNESLPSAVLEVSTPDDLPPAAPTNLQVSDVRGKRATLDWEAPADQDIYGYDIWIGPHDNFLQSEGTRWNTERVTDLSYIVRELQKDHDYWARVQTVDEGGNRSPLSNTVFFHTLPNLPPVADFTFADYNSRGIPVTFYPDASSDGDDDLEDLSFSWDFDGDMVEDLNTDGPENAFYQYDIRGPYSVTLTLDDGEFQDSITKTVFISSQVTYWVGPEGTGLNVRQVGADASPDGRRAVLYQNSNANSFVAYDDGTGFETIQVGVNGDLCGAVTLIPGGFAVVIYNLVPKDTGWKLYEYTGGVGTLIYNASGSLTKFRAVPYDCDLDYLPGAGYSVVLSGTSEKTDRMSDYNVGCWHQNADGSFKLVQPFPLSDFSTELNVSSRVACARSADSSWFLMMDRPLSDGLLLLEVDDAGETYTHFTAPANTLSSARLVTDPAADTQLHWAWTSAGQPDRIQYGDNFGADNEADQFIDAGDALISISTIVPGLDNELRAVIATRAADDVEYLRLLDTSTAADEELRSGIGRIGRAQGRCWASGGQLSGFIGCEESCDSELVGTEISASANAGDEVLYSPTLPYYIGGTSVPLAFDDGRLICVFQQHYPTAVSLEFPTFKQAPTYGYRGKDNYVDPVAGVPLGIGYSYLLASITPQNNAVVYHFADQYAETGTHIHTFEGANRVTLIRRRDGSEIMAAYTGNNGTSLNVSTWGGNFGVGTELYSGVSPILKLVLAENPAGGWGIAFLDNAGELRLVEKTQLGWGAMQLLDNGSGINTKGGVGLAYSELGDAVIGVERNNGDDGFYAGLREVGNPWEWEEVNSSSGDNGYGMACFYHIGIPMVTYYLGDAGLTAWSRLHIAERYSGSWFDVEQFAELQGLPFGYTVDQEGNIIITGYSLAWEPTRSLTYVLTP
ncbi:fibronectin type III domain-containing protein [bacterium]|nr:fibronectin type III domain-containing protein [bacterium]